VGSASFQFHPELTLVDLAWNGLVRIQDRTFEAQRKLTVLRLSGNRLSHFDNLTFYGLESLRLLDLSKNQLVRLPGDLLEHLPLLEELYLADNRIQAVDSSFFSGLCCLKKLNLARNELAGINLGSPGLLPRLEELDLSGNRLSSLQLDHLPLLGVLDLSGNNLLANISSRSLSTLPSLSILNLSSLGLSHIPSEMFLHMRSLKKLFLNGNSFTAVLPNAFADLSQLVHLELRDNPQLEEVSSGGFLGLGQLTSLHLARNRQLSRLEPGALEPLHSLRLLNLEQNSLVSLEPSSAFHQIVDLRLGGNPWDCNCSLRPLQINLASRGNTSNLVCDKPPGLQFQDVLAVNLAASCPLPTQLEANYTLIVALCATILSLLCLAGIVVAVVFHRRLSAACKRRRWAKSTKHGGHQEGLPEHLFSIYPGQVGRDIPVTEL
jgi:Leucine-rich repeat (LRR) protein